MEHQCNHITFIIISYERAICTCSQQYRGAWSLEQEYNQFTSKGVSKRSTHYEITHYYGTIRIKSVEKGKFWRETMSKRLIVGSGVTNDKTINNNDTLFKVVNLGNNVIFSFITLQLLHLSHMLISLPYNFITLQ